MPVPSGRTSMGSATMPGTVATRASDPLYGKYRGRVTATNDPAMKGRIKALVPYPFGQVETLWAEPALPPGEFNPPKVGDGVWIEFEMGDRDLPIWSGCWFRQGESPFQAIATKLQLNDEETTTTPEQDHDHSGFHDHKKTFYSPHIRCWRSPSGHALIFEDWKNADGTPGVGRVTLLHRNGLSIELREEGQIEIDAGDFASLILDSASKKITVTSSQSTVEIDGALKKTSIIADTGVSLVMDAVSKIVTLLAGDITLDPGTGQVIIGSAKTDTGARQLMTKADADKIVADLNMLRSYVGGHIHTSGASGSPTTTPAVPPPTLQYTVPVLTQHVKGK